MLNDCFNALFTSMSFGKQFPELIINIRFRFRFNDYQLISLRLAFMLFLSLSGGRFVVPLLIGGSGVPPLLSVHDLSDVHDFDFTSILHVISSFIISLAILHVIRFEFITSYSSLSKTPGASPDNTRSSS